MVFGVSPFACAQANSSAAAAAPAISPAAKPAAAPATPIAASAKAPDFAKEAMVIDKSLTRIREEADGTGTRETTARVRVLADAGVKEFAVLEFTYTAMNQQLDIGYVRVIKPDGTVVKTPDYNVQDLPADVTRQAPMYSDIHQKHVAVKGLGVGDTLEYQTTLRTLKPEVPGQFWLEYSFEKTNIAVDEELDLDVPADKPVTVASADVKPTITTASGRKLYHWASQNLSRPDADAPPKSLKKWKPSVQVTTFASWEQVGAWYQSLQKDQLTVTPAIQAKADALTKGLTTDDEKIHAIFNAVALHIHYVGLEFGIGRYQPHPADDVLSNEYGDCKDKHTLLATLLKAEGIEAWPVLINSGRELDPATPSPGQFDHVITVVPRGDKLIWMDSTEEVAPVGIIAAGLRDKQALMIPAARSALLEQTPAELPYPQSVRFVATGSMSEKGLFTAHLDQTYHGDVEMLLREAFRRVPQSRWKELVQRFSGSMGFGGEVKEPQVSEVENTAQALHLSYDYTREKYSEWDDHRINPALPPVGFELMPGIKVIKPADDVELGSPGEQDLVSKIEMPAGYRVFPPPNVDLKQDWAEYQATYSFENGMFTAERRMVIRKEKVPLADWDKLLEFRRAIWADAVKMSTVLTPDQAGNVPAQAIRNNEAATSRYQQMSAEMQPLRDATAILFADAPPTPDGLAKSLDQCREAVRTIEEKSQRLPPNAVSSLYWGQMLGVAWTARGWLELESQHLDAAVSYLRAAWNLTQDQFAAYELARALELSGQKSEAAHMYELAYVANSSPLMGNLAQSVQAHDLSAKAYQKLTGKLMTATLLNRGQYNGSLRAEMDKDVEKRQYISATHINGEGFFSVAYEDGKPVKAQFLAGEKRMTSLQSAIEKNRFPVPMPAGSKARLEREIKLICTQYGGCDAYLLLPDKVEMPQVVYTLGGHEIKLLKVRQAP